MPSRPFTVEEYVALNRPAQLSIAPDGESCVFVVVETDPRESRITPHLRFVEIEGVEQPNEREGQQNEGDGQQSEEIGKTLIEEDNPRHNEEDGTRRITFSQDGEESPRFSPDGEWIAFLSRRPDATRPEPELEEGEEPPPQIWVLPLGGEARCLTAQREGVRAYDWMPDGSELIYLSHEPRPKALQAHHLNRRDARNDAVVEGDDRRPIGVWRIGIEPGAEEERIWRGDPGGMDLRVSPDGRRAVYVTNGTGDPNDYKKIDLWLIDLERGTTKQLTDRPNAEWRPRWSPDGSEVAFLAPLDEELSYSQARIWTVSVESGEIRSFLPDLDLEIEAFEWPMEGPNSDELIAVASAGLEQDLIRLNRRTGEASRIIEEPGSCRDLSVSPDGSRIAVIREDAGHWPDLYVVSREEGHGSGVPRRLTNLNPGWRDVEIGPHRSFHWTSDGMEIEGMLVLPPGTDRAGPFPTVVFIHGGPHASVLLSPHQEIAFAFLAHEGYAVLAPNYRGSCGGGAAFSVASRRDPGGGDLRDILAGVDAAVAAGIADPDRLAIMGSSYGGYLTNWAISQTDRFKAAISMFGIFNFITDFSNSEVPEFERDYLGGYYWESPDLYIERSPFHHVTQIHTPVLLLHGEEDGNTSITNSREMYRALRSLEREVRFVRYPREGHGFDEPGHLIDAHRRIVSWLDMYLRSSGSPVPLRIDESAKGGDGRSIRVTTCEPIEPAGHEQPERSRVVHVIFALVMERENDRFHLPLETIELRAGGEPCGFLGVPLRTLDETILVEGTGMTVTFAGKEPPSAFPVSVAFRVPDGAAEAALTVPGFPSIRLPVPPPEVKDGAEGHQRECGGNRRGTDDGRLTVSGGAPVESPSGPPAKSLSATGATDESPSSCDDRERLP